MSAKELQEYEDDAINRAVHRIDSRIKNSSIEHANILIKAMINHASEADEIYIYSGCLPKDTFNMLGTTKAKRIQVLVDSDDDISWTNSILDSVREKISISKIERPRPNHFLCTTGGFFRFETDAKNFEAEANFNEPHTIDVLVKAFDRYSVNATKVV